MKIATKAYIKRANEDFIRKKAKIRLQKKTNSKNLAMVVKVDLDTYNKIIKTCNENKKQYPNLSELLYLKS